ncbi:PREDICTED: adhesion G-protein coupled receptor G2-like [Amphimedon queenslandica]|uniref:GPS domain-containing protein n=2 Tax=Amphimedon queenslandica TaxID=400682 RepID=A0AAN0IJ44_AMPQE|nr:PREDICTED: adhesion G-protein coupled receptor G2-like [Amphimedon queenslandica]|eukprot:XP_003391736.2 PREDICTED: adhesion G-protein coupled receptor G2-like [Amphimedon queenslandica]
MSLNELVMNSTDNDQSIDNIIIVSNVLNQTAILISDHATLSPSNLTVITETVIQTLDIIEEWPAIMKAEGNQIIQSFEGIVDAVLNYDNDTNIDIVERNIAFKIRKVTRSSYNKLTFTATASNGSLMIDTDGNSTNTIIGSITIPKSILNVTTDAQIKVAFSLYEETAFFPIRDPPPNTIVGSSVISARIAGVSDGTQLPDPVVITLALKTNNFSNPFCVYWDFKAAEGGGNWSTDGCTVEAANSSVTCHCNHLTNFAILVDISRRTEGPTQSPRHIAVALDMVSYFGVGISLVGLILTIITLVIFKKIRTKDASKFHIQLCVSLSLMLLVFVSGISEVSPKEGCITVGVLIHYFALVAWMWMGAEALLMFQKLVIVFVNVSWYYHLAVSIVCWGLPLIPVTILLVVDYNYYLTLDENDSG